MREPRGNGRVLFLVFFLQGLRDVAGVRHLGWSRDELLSLGAVIKEGSTAIAKSTVMDNIKSVDSRGIIVNRDPPSEGDGAGSG